MCSYRLFVLVLAAALVFVAATLPTAVYAATIRVPSDQPTIQAGLNAAASGDTVLVASGVYNEIIFWPFRNGIVLIGAGMDSTYVMGNQLDCVLQVVNAVAIDTTTVIRGLHLRNGGDAGLAVDGASPLMVACAIDSTRKGPGIHCWNGSSSTIRNCRIEDNNDVSSGGGVKLENCGSATQIVGNSIKRNSLSSGHGAGVYIYNSPCTVRDNTIAEHSVYGGNGGGIYCEQSQAMIKGNRIAGNVANEGGGIYCIYGSPTIMGNEISANRSTTDSYYDKQYYGGGGIYCIFSSPTILTNIISNNEAVCSGGGIHLARGCAPDILGNTIVGNTATLGAGIHCWNVGDPGNPIVEDNIIVRNQASADGGGIYRYTCSATISRNSISENVAFGNGGGVFSYSVSEPIEENTVCRNIAQGNGGGIYLTSSSVSQFLRNTMTENSAQGVGDGIYTENSILSVSYCNIAWNGWGLHNASLQQVPQAAQNWWGHSSGPWHAGGNPTGQGDSLSQHAWKFVPWLAEADTAAPPVPPTHLVVEEWSGCSLRLSWDAVPISDLAGYRVYFDTVSTGFSYGSMIDVGNVTEYILEGLRCDTTYHIAVTCYDIGGEESWYSGEFGTTTVVSVPDMTGAPTALRIEGNYPNPFNPQTSIVYSLPNEGPAELAIYDVRGRRLVILADRLQAAGRHSVVWTGRDENGSELVSGVYFVRLEFGGDVQKRKIVLVK